MKAVLALTAITLLAACGADGEPERPAPKPSSSGVSVEIHGTAEMGISG